MSGAGGWIWYKWFYSDHAIRHTHGALAIDPETSHRERAEAGDRDSQYGYAILLKEGMEGVRKDPKEAFKWLERAAHQGHVRAQYELALAFKFGRGTFQDYGQAAHWLTRAAKRGNADAQYHLGRAYRIGEGVTASLIESYVWLNRAAAQGHSAARSVRDEVATSLKPDELKQAQQLSREPLDASLSGVIQPVASTATGL